MLNSYFRQLRGPGGYICTHCDGPKRRKRLCVFLPWELLVELQVSAQPFQLLLPWIEQYLPALAFIKCSIRFRRFIDAHHLIHQTNRRTHTPEDVLAPLEEVDGEREDGTDGAAPEGEGQVLVEAVPASEWERHGLVHTCRGDDAERADECVCEP